MIPIYFDNAASTRPLDEVIGIYAAESANLCGNPASLHRMGLAAETAIRQAASETAALLNATAGELVFTSGGTESNNLAILGAINNRSVEGVNAVTTVTEHPSVYECFKELEKKGLHVTYLKTDARGRIDTGELRGAVNERTALVSVAHVCGETGTIQDIGIIGRAVKERNPYALFHVDGAQAFGKLPVDIRGSRIDFYSASAHKIHGLKGAGCLFVKNGRRLAPLFFGGPQQNGVRPGTENAAGVMAFAAAARTAYGCMDNNLAQVTAVRDALMCFLIRDGVIINGDANGSPYILNASFMGYKGEVIVNALSEAGVCASTGSACNERRGKANALTRMGLGPERAGSAVRFSFSRFNTTDEAERCGEILQNILKTIVRL